MYRRTCKATAPTVEHTKNEKTKIDSNFNDINTLQHVKQYNNIYDTFNKTSDWPECLLPFFKGVYVPLSDETGVSTEIPEWVDLARIKNGQEFVKKYFYGLNFAQTVSLLYLFSAPSGLEPLIFTDKSHTPKLAHRRYLSTAVRVLSWYETDFWNPSSEGYKHIKAVKNLHVNVKNRINKCPVEERKRKVDLNFKLAPQGLQCPFVSTLRKDLDTKLTLSNQSSGRPPHLNQLDMCLTQFAFFGFMITYPDKFGAKSAMKEELSDFVHLWRYIGHLLGVDDEFNYAKGEYEEVLERCRCTIDYLVKPMFHHISEDWEHMSRCALQGIEKFTKLTINFEATVFYFCWLLDIELPYSATAMDWKVRMHFKATKFAMTTGSRIPGFAKMINHTVRQRIEEAKKKNNMN